MKVIPVIDLLRGKVVHARGGARSEYQPIESRLCADSDPLSVVESILSLHSFDRLYVADLDAITGTGDHREVLSRISRRYPRLNLWVDAGFRSAEAAGAFSHLGLGQPVVGSESLSAERTPDIRSWAAEVVLSLDFRDRGFLGPEELLINPEFWPDDVIVMSLAHVGLQQGPDMHGLSEFKKRSGERRIYAAGGIRGSDDLAALDQLGIAGALVATALHDGSLNLNHLERYS